MVEHMPGDRGAGGRFVRVDDGDMHVVEDDKPGAPALLLIHGTGASTAWWDPGGPEAGGCLPCHPCRPARPREVGEPRRRVRHPCSGPPRRRRAGPARRGPGDGDRAFHGGTVATALAEQRPGGGGAGAHRHRPEPWTPYIDQGLLGRVLLAPLPGWLLWRLRTEATIRKAMRHAFTRPVDIPDAPHRGHAGDDPPRPRGNGARILDYLRQRSVPDRLATLGLPVLVIFGAGDQRWRSSSAAAYRVVPGPASSCRRAWDTPR